MDYTLLALSSSLWMLYVGRLISGVTGATGAVAASVIADNTASQERTKWFGRLGAALVSGQSLALQLAALQGNSQLIFLLLLLPF